VLLWPADLSIRLPVIGLVGSYPTNYLIGHEPILNRLTAFTDQGISPRSGYRELAPVSRSYARVKGRLSVCCSPVCR
jgi:hypothetical protein